jgi:hypothetical protein
MTSMYNKSYDKQDGWFFFSNKSYLQKGQGSSNEFYKTYKPIYVSKSCLFYNKKKLFYPILHCQYSSNSFY